MIKTKICIKINYLSMFVKRDWLNKSIDRCLISDNRRINFEMDIRESDLAEITRYATSIQIIPDKNKIRKEITALKKQLADLEGQLSDQNR